MYFRIGFCADFHAHARACLRFVCKHYAQGQYSAMRNADKTLNQLGSYVQEKTAGELCA